MIDSGDALMWRAMQLVKRSEALRRLERRVERSLSLLSAHFVLRDCDCGSRVAATGYVAVANKGVIRIGDLVTFLGGMIPSELHCGKGASIEIGEKTLFNYGVSIRADESIIIGKNCMFASFTVLHDRCGARRGPIVIGDDVWVAHGAVIEPGVTIGAGSVISARAVVSKDIPERSLVMGNPAVAMSLRMARA